MKVQLSNVVKTYGDNVVLRDVNLVVEKGDFVVITGASGAGKSTILKLILQQIHPSSGIIYVDNTQLSAKSNKFSERVRRETGVVFQDYLLITNKTIEENLRLALDINNIAAKEFDARIEIVLQRTGLTNKRQSFPSQLSGGELQRASLARALVVGPKLLLADEPTGNLDPHNTQKIIQILEEINASGTTIIMTTHRLEVLPLAKKTLYELENGQIQEKKSSIHKKNKHEHS